MKILIIIFLVLFLTSCSDGVRNLHDGKQDTLVKVNIDTSIVTSQNDNESHDTIFCNSRFLVIGSKKMKMDYIPAKVKSYKITSKGDTLYHDYYATILGDENYSTYVYVKYSSKYKFSQFLVDSMYHGKLSLPDVSIIKNTEYWKSKIKCNYLDINQWKNHLITKCKEEGINFAGHYTIVDWGCGCQCQLMAIIDRIDGKIYFPNIPEDHIDGFYGVQFQKNSRMIITNSAVLEDYKGYCLKYYDCYPKIYEWRDSVAKRIE